MKKSKARALSLRTTVGARIREARTKQGMSQEALAETCGLHRTYVGSVERAERNVSIDNIERIALALQLPPSALLEAIK